jgi:hypothetical protein
VGVLSVKRWLIDDCRAVLPATFAQIPVLSRVTDLSDYINFYPEVCGIAEAEKWARKFPAGKFVRGVASE